MQIIFVNLSNPFSVFVNTIQFQYMIQPIQTALISGNSSFHIWESRVFWGFCCYLDFSIGISVTRDKHHIFNLGGIREFLFLNIGPMCCCGAKGNLLTSIFYTMWFFQEKLIWDIFSNIFFLEKHIQNFGLKFIFVHFHSNFSGKSRMVLHFYKIDESF